MSEAPRAVKGMGDLLAPDVYAWQFVEETARAVLEAFAYREIRTPILEYTPLFVRSVGEATEVVEKQMYTFEDRDGASVTLRPEGTAPVVRAYVERATWGQEPVTRWYYLGPMFRHERAQRGRLRQFHQIGGEVFGLPGPAIDAEMVAMLAALFAEVGLAAKDVEITVNTLGEPDERARYREALRAYFAGHEDKLDEDSRRRLDANPLRILDSKNPDVQAVAAGAPALIDHLGPASAAHFAAFREHLAALGVAAVVDPRLVRGLDYYTRTIFEIKATRGELGAQNTICGGGRYDGLVASLGGADVPALGFAIGIERLLLAMDRRAAEYVPALAVFVAPLGERARAFALPLAHRLRAAGVRTEVEHRDASLKSQLKRADKLGARLAVIVGDQELDTGKIVLRNLAAGTQQEVALADVEAKVRAALD